MNEYTKLNKQLAEGRASEELKTRAAVTHGTKGDLPSFYRFVVLETVFDPSTIDPNKISYYSQALGVSNLHFANILPRNTIVGQRVADPNSPSTSQPMFLFPFFPPSMSFPAQPGEHVWVMFENPGGSKKDLGYWMCRIVEPGFVEDANHTHPPRANDPSFAPGTAATFEGTAQALYEYRNGRADLRDGERYTIAETATMTGGEDAYEKIITTTDAGKLSVLEPVPRFKKRPADISLEGTNNTLIVLGRDRTSTPASFKVDEVNRSNIVDTTVPGADVVGPGAGAIDIVAGRGQTPLTGGAEVDVMTLAGAPAGHKELGKASTEISEFEGDPDFLNDRSRIYVAQRTKVDANLSLTTFNAEMGAGTVQGGAPADAEKKQVVDVETGDGAIIVKSDKVRIIARSDVEIMVSGYASRDAKGNLVASDNPDDHAAVVIKANGDIVFRPSRKGFVKLGGDDADKGLVCSDIPVQGVDGVVVGAPLITTMGGQFAGSAAGAPNDNGPALAGSQAKFAAKVLVK